MARSRSRLCAVYTRKSSEEGLDQAFNSLDAQREACEAYITSQAGEGWKLVDACYDDGGISGGTIERPALQRLMGDIRVGTVNTVVVYKVDRLTRSLADFAKLVELFDTHEVSFVSITQQFNTTTSMGRLTLNMLLSFAQFEREVTGERIRDKIAASKKKGMWMGGYVPLGYDVKDQQLIISEAEAETVRAVFALYIEYENVRQVKEEADIRGLTTKVRTSENGGSSGGRPLSRGYIYKLLKNPLYVGKIAHKGNVYLGQHDPIISDETWKAVQEVIAGNRQDRASRPRITERSLLEGRLFDQSGDRLTPTHAVKAGKRYRYYVSRALISGGDAATTGYRIPAYEIEMLVADVLKNLISDRTRLFELLSLDRYSASQIHQVLVTASEMVDTIAGDSPDGAYDAIRSLIDRAEIGDRDIRVAISVAGTKKLLGLELPSDDRGIADDELCQWVTVPARFKRSGGASRMIISDGEGVRGKPDPTLVKTFGRAHDWFERLRSKEVENVADIARAEGFTRPYVARVLRLAFLAPDITDAILRGEEPLELNAERLLRCPDLPIAWDEQRRLFGFSNLRLHSKRNRLFGLRRKTGGRAGDVR